MGFTKTASVFHYGAICPTNVVGLVAVDTDLVVNMCAVGTAVTIIVSVFQISPPSALEYSFMCQRVSTDYHACTRVFR